MKKHILIFLLLFLSNGYSQEIDPINIVEYSLILQDKVSSVTISVNKLSISDRKLTFKTETQSCNFQQGIVITFLNNETVKLRDHALNCKSLENGQFELSGTLTLDDELYEKLNSFDLLEFQLGSINIPAYFQGEENMPNLLAWIRQEN